MIHRSDLSDYNITFDRMSNRFIMSYKELEEDINHIKVFTGLLLNEYFINPFDVHAIIDDVHRYCKILMKNMLDDDYYLFILDYIEVLEVMEKEFILQEKFEICNNIRSYITRFDARVYLKEK